MIRTVLSDAQWEHVAPELPGKIGDPGCSGDDNRLFVEGVLWVVRTGAPWRNLVPSMLVHDGILLAATPFLDRFRTKPRATIAGSPPKQIPKSKVLFTIITDAQWAKLDALGSLPCVRVFMVLLREDLRKKNPRVGS